MLADWIVIKLEAIGLWERLSNLPITHVLGNKFDTHSTIINQRILFGPGFGCLLCLKASVSIGGIRI